MSQNIPKNNMILDMINSDNIILLIQHLFVKFNILTLQKVERTKIKFIELARSEM